MTAPSCSGALGTEDGGKQVVRETGIEGDAAFDVRAQSDLAFNHNQRAGLVLRKKICGQHNVIVGVAIGGRSAEERQPPAQVRKHVPDLRLKDDDQREHQVRKYVADNPVQRGEFADARQIKGDGHHQQPHQHGNGTRAADHHQDLVNEHCHQKNIERHPRGLRP